MNERKDIHNRTGMEKYQKPHPRHYSKSGMLGVLITMIISSSNLATSHSLEARRSHRSCSEICEYDSGFNGAHCEERGLYHVPMSTGCEHAIRLELQENHIQYLTMENLSGYRHIRTLDVSRNDISFIGQGTFMRLKHLRKVLMYHKQVRFLQNRTFLGTEDHLAEIDLSYNELVEVNDNAFRGLSKVIELYLSYNQIEILPSSVFCEMHELQKLFLSKNNLQNLNRLLLCGLQKLKFVNLDSNNLTWIPEGLFSNLESLQEVILSNNNLVSIPPVHNIGHVNYKVFDVANNRLNQSRSILPYLQSSERVYMEGNPFICDCDFLNLQHWYSSLSFTERINYKSRPPVMCEEYEYGIIGDIPLLQGSSGKVKCLFNHKSDTDSHTTVADFPKQIDSISTKHEIEWNVKLHSVKASYYGDEKIIFVISVYNAVIVTTYFVVYVICELLQGKWQNIFEKQT